MEDVLAYWSLKRRSRCGVPLIRRLQVYTTQKQLGRRSNEGLNNYESVSPVGDASPRFAGLQKEVADQLYRTGKLSEEFELFLVSVGLQSV